MNTAQFCLRSRPGRVARTRIDWKNSAFATTGGGVSITRRLHPLMGCRTTGSSRAFARGARYECHPFRRSGGRWPSTPGIDRWPDDWSTSYTTTKDRRPCQCRGTLAALQVDEDVSNWSLDRHYKQQTGHFLRFLIWRQRVCWRHAARPLG